MDFSLDDCNELSEICKCPKCNRVLKNKKVIRDHLRYCKRESYLQCGHCSFVTKYNANLKIHILSQHFATKNTEREVCSKCAKTFKNQRCLQMHMRICESPRLFHCYDCSKKFKSKSNLKSHVSRIHLKVSVDGEVIGKDLYLKCNECLYKTRHKDDLKKHVIKHYGDRKEDCQKCGRSYKNQGYLKKHMKFCQTQPLGCYRCSFKTHSKSNLKYHVYRMHVEGTRYECPACGKTYKKESYILKHIERDCGKEPDYMCEYCPFRSKYSFSLKKHRANMHLKNNNLIEDD